MTVASHHKPNWLGKPAAEMRADAQAHSDQQSITQRCLFCKWSWVGLAHEGRAKALVHRERKHPETIGRKTYRKREVTKGWRRDVPDEVIEGNNRARAEREEADKLATIERGRIRREQAA